jgi:hypothetical protein
MCFKIMNFSGPLIGLPFTITCRQMLTPTKIRGKSIRCKKRVQPHNNVNRMSG